MFREIFNFYKYFKEVKKHNEITFYSESGIYFFYYKGLIEAILRKSDYSILYITSDNKDPIFDIEHSKLKVFYINKLIPFFFPFARSKALIMTLTDLNNFHIRKTANNVNHIYVFHAINSIHMIYTKEAFNHYDTIFCVGPHHIEELKTTEKIYDLPPKKLVPVGYYWLEEINKKYFLSAPKRKHDEKKVMIAPSWSAQNIMETCINGIVPKLLSAGYYVVVRPHPEFAKRKKYLLGNVAENYKHEQKFELETNLASELNWYDSDILITDWSGISFEFAWGMEKPVVFIDTPMKIHNPEYRKIGVDPLEVRIRHKIGRVLKLDEIENIDTIIADIIEKQDDKKKELKALRDENIFNWGHASEVGADYIIEYLNNT